jgi:hypothetical protein
MAKEWLNTASLRTVSEEHKVQPTSSQSNDPFIRQELAKHELTRLQMKLDAYQPSPGWQKDGTFVPPIVANAMLYEAGQIGNHFMRVDCEELNHLWLIGLSPMRFPHIFFDQNNNHNNNNHNSKHSNNMQQQMHTPHTSVWRGMRGQKTLLKK